MKTLALGLFYRETMEVKRATKIGGVYGAAVTVLEDLKCTFAIPADPSGLQGLRETEVIQTMTEVFLIHVKGLPDIREGDVVVVAGVEYIVRLQSAMNVPSLLAAMEYTRLTVEKL